MTDISDSVGADADYVKMEVDIPIKAESEQDHEVRPKLSPIQIPDHNGDVPIQNAEHVVSTPIMALPSLRGQHAEENSAHIYRGLWAMSDYAHTLEGQTSEFELRLVEPNAGLSKYPYSGKYIGWFNLKHPAPKPGHIRVEDKDVFLAFSSPEGGASDGSCRVTGEGQNKFGKFTVHGTLSHDGKHLQLYKMYKQKKPLGVTPKAGKTPSASSVLKPQTPREVENTPREARIRKPSAVLAQVYASAEVPALSKSSSTSHKEPTAVSTPAAANATPRLAPQPSTTAAPVTALRDSGRAVRLSPVLQKCMDLLKELQKNVQAAFFRDPVDYVKLCIPDYPDIVREPMDFGTIHRNLENSVYLTHEPFAEHVRLVFKNAITYNQRRDHPVHIAARELSGKFEERYRNMVAQVNPDFETDFRGIIAGSDREKSNKKSKVRHSTGVYTSGGSRSASGPHSAAIPPALDINMQTILEMQRTMMEMQQELKQLRTQLRQNDIKSSIEVKRQAAQVPMTLDEKQALVERINRLDEDRMKEVIEIVQEVFPAAANSDSDDVDIPIDDLDTLTLRRLQAVVQVGD